MKRISMENYGKLVEQYIYSTKNDKVDRISYNWWDESGEEQAYLNCTYVGTIPILFVNKWLDKKPDVVPMNEMKLNFNMVRWPKFDLRNIQMIDKNSPLVSVNERDHEYIYVSSYADGINGEITVPDNYVLFDNKNKNVIEAYESLEDVSNNKCVTRMTAIQNKSKESDCPITILEGVEHNKIYIVTNNEFGLEIEGCRKNNNIIGILNNECETVSAKYNKYHVEYFDDMLFKVESEGKLYSRYEKAVSSYTDARSTTKCVYPTIFKDNIEMYKYDFMKLWSFDRLDVDGSKKISTFTRSIYLLEDYDELLKDIRDHKGDEICLILDD